MNQGTPATDAETRASGYLMLREMSDHTIAVAIIEADEAVAQHRRTADEFRAEFQRRITDSGGTMLDDPDFTIELKPGPVSLDVGIIVAVKEQLSEENLAKCYTPAHQETIDVPEKWSLVQLNALARRYGVVARIVERARVPGRPRVVWSANELHTQRRCKPRQAAGATDPPKHL